LFANQKYVTLSGTAVPRDYVEFPSQINEHAALDPTVLKINAVHYQTKQAIPQELIDKIKKQTPSTRVCSNRIVGCRNARYGLA